MHRQGRWRLHLPIQTATPDESWMVRYPEGDSQPLQVVLAACDTVRLDHAALVTCTWHLVVVEEGLGQKDLAEDLSWLALMGVSRILVTGVPK